MEPQRRPAVQAHADLRRARARPPGRHHAEGRARARARVLRQGRGVPAPRRRALPHAVATRRRRRRAGALRPTAIDAQLLADAITAALPKATVPAEDADAEPYGWGRQHDVRALELGGDAARGGRVCGYIAKYATKSTEDAGGVTLPHRGRSTSCAACAAATTPAGTSRPRGRLGARPELDGSACAGGRISSGYGGHCFTKSRRYSTTFKALREARAEHAAGAPRARCGTSAKSDHNLIRAKGVAVRRTRLSARGGRAPGRCQWPRGRASSAVWRARRKPFTGQRRYRFESRTGALTATRREIWRWCGEVLAGDRSLHRGHARRGPHQQPAQ